MVDYKKILVGILILLASSSIIYISFNNQARIRVDRDKTTFYIQENSRWIVSGREFNKLFDGTSLMYRRLALRTVNTTVTDSEVNIVRSTGYIRGSKIVDTYFFDGKIDDIESFPITHKVEIFNAKGKFYRYEARNLVYDGPAYALQGETELSFGRNMKIELQEGYRWARVYKSGIVKAQYDIKSDYEVFYIRMYDPSSWCYQETANVTTACGGLDTGVYKENTWWSDDSAEPVFDGNWSSENHGVAANLATLEINYTKPTGAESSSLWQYKDEGAMANFTIPSSCWNYNANKLVFEVTSNEAAQLTDWYCHNNTGWESLKALTGVNSKVYEEAMHWNITSASVTSESTRIRTYQDVTIGAYRESGLDVLLDFTSDASDSSGNSNNFSLESGATVGSGGKYGNGLILDGTNDYVTDSHATIYDCNPSCSFSMWIKSNDGGTDDILTESAGRYTIYAENDNIKLGSDLYGAGTTSTINVNWDGTSGTWYHACGSMTNGSNQVLCVNGNCDTDAGAITVTTTTALNLGKQGDYASFNGTIDDFQWKDGVAWLEADCDLIYAENTTYSDSPRTQVYQDSLGGQPVRGTGLDVLLELNSDASDTSGNGNNFTLVGGAAITTTAGQYKYGGGAVVLDGLDDHVERTDATLFDCTDKCSFSIWVKNDVGGDEDIFGTDNGGDISLYAEETSIYLYNDEVGVSSFVNCAWNTNAGTWYHACGSMTNGSNQVLCVNGNCDTDANVAGNAGIGKMYLGEQITYEEFDGVMDDFQWKDGVAWLEADCDAIYAETSTYYESERIKYYQSVT